MHEIEGGETSTRSVGETCCSNLSEKSARDWRRRNLNTERDSRSCRNFVEKKLSIERITGENWIDIEISYQIKFHHDN